MSDNHFAENLIERKRPKSDSANDEHEHQLNIKFIGSEIWLICLIKHLVKCYDFIIL